MLVKFNMCDNTRSGNRIDRKLFAGIINEIKDITDINEALFAAKNYQKIKGNKTKIIDMS